MVLGIDPYVVVRQGREDYLVKVAMMQKAHEFRLKEQEALAVMVSNAVARAFGGT